MLVIGLTGNIGSGKSTVAQLLSERGATIIDADVLARRAVELGTPAYDKIVERWGTSIVGPDRQLDRSALRRTVFSDATWLLIDREGNTGRQVHQWLHQQKWPIQPAMELDSFDAIVNLVSLGLGVSMVPHRVLPLYKTRREVRRINIKPRFSRELAVVVRKNRQQPEHLAAFIESILF